MAEPRTVGAGHGATWWGEGWRLFTPAVGVWLLIWIILVVVYLAAALTGIGSLVMHVLLPVFTGGMMLGCRALDRGNPLTLGHLFAGFSQRTGPLVVVGLIYTGLGLLVTLLVAGMMVALFGVAIFNMLAGTVDPSQSGIALDSVVVAVLLCVLFFLLLLLPLIMAVWFAPALVMLGGLSPGAAMAASFRGCLRNVVPFLLYGLIGFGLAIVASIPFGLGWLVLGPVTMATIYTSYCDIFEDQGPA
jgi:uncharacterized membrane protein